MCDAILLGRYSLSHTSCGHNSKWAVFEMWHYFSRGAILVVVVVVVVVVLVVAVYMCH